MTQLRLEGTNGPGPRQRELSQFFSPPETAQRIVDWALRPFWHQAMLKVLEPSAGHGALADRIRDAGHSVTCIDIDPENVAVLHRKGHMATCMDFLEYDCARAGGWKAYDLVVQNSPFEGGQTERHILHALKCARRVIAHGPLTTLAGQDRKRELWDRVRVHRIAICSTRPKYSADGGATEMMTVDVSLRAAGDNLEDNPEVSWWP